MLILYVQSFDVFLKSDYPLGFKHDLLVELHNLLVKGFDLKFQLVHDIVVLYSPPFVLVYLSLKTIFLLLEHSCIFLKVVVRIFSTIFFTLELLSQIHNFLLQ